MNIGQLLIRSKKLIQRPIQYLTDGYTEIDGRVVITFSMALIVCRETLHNCASCSWDRSFAARAAFSFRFFIRLPLSVYIPGDHYKRSLTDISEIVFSYL